MQLVSYPAQYKKSEYMTFTRRQFSLQIAWGIGLSGIALAASQNEDNEISHTADAIHQEVNLSANRKRIYATLLDAKQFDEMTRLIPSMQTAKPGNSPTEISSELGGTFTLFRGHIIGRQVEFVPNQRIVQAWRVVDWAPGVYSIVSSNSNLRAPEPGSSSTTPISPSASPNTLPTAGKSTTGSRCRST